MFSDHTAQSDRTTLRAELRARRDAIAAPARIAAAVGVAVHLSKLPEFLTDPDIAGYWAISGELPLLSVLAGMRSRGQRYLLPMIGRDRTLQFAPWKPGDAIEANRYGIPEPIRGDTERLAPASLDIVLVPLLGFDRNGNRIGYGGGFYDRSFAFLRDQQRPSKPMLVGVAYAMQEIKHIEPAAWDVRLDYVVTENELIVCEHPAAHQPA